MSINLPEPDQLDVWGTQLNTAILSIEDQVIALQAQVADLQEQVDGSGEDGIYVPLTLVGQENGVASLDSAGRIPVGQMGALNYQDVGAAPTAHQHSLADLPAVTLAIDASPAIGRFNTTTNTWPSRVSLTGSASRCVIWWGDADVPADAIAGTDIYFRQKTSGSTVPTPEPEPDPTATPDANGITQAIPVVTVNGSAYSITANITTTDNKTFTYLQLAVRGPNGEASDTGYNNGRVINSATYQVVGSGTATSIGDWTARLAYNITGAADTWVDGPSVTFSIASLGGVPTTPGTGTPGSGNVPVLGLSGKAWNSGVFEPGGGNVSTANNFFNWRGRAGDAITYFVPRSGNIEDFKILPAGLTAWPGYRIVSAPTQPDYLDNSYAASGQANAFWLSFGLYLKNQGWDDGRTIMRLNWEGNGNWYAWSWVNGGASNFVNAIKNAVTQIRVHAPNTKFNVCVNRGNQNGGVNWQTQIMDPLIGYIDIIGLDNYDFAPPSRNESEWNSMANISPGLEPVAAYCRAKGLKMWIDEWGVCDTVGPYPGGFDNPFYINRMHTWFAANTDVLAGECYFNVSADGLFQMLWPNTNKPNSAEAYRTAW